MDEVTNYKIFAAIASKAQYLELPYTWERPNKVRLKNVDYQSAMVMRDSIKNWEKRFGAKIDWDYDNFRMEIKWRDK